MTEEWRAIKDYEGLYEVSNLGRVRSLDRLIPDTRWGGRQFRKGRVLRLQNSKGYRTLNLCKDGLQAQVYVHRIVAIAFLDPPLQGQNTVNHKYGAASGDCASGLEWATPAENMQHALQTGLRSTKLSTVEVNEIKQLCVDGRFKSDIAHAFGVTRQTVCRIARKERS